MAYIIVPVISIVLVFLMFRNKSNKTTQIGKVAEIDVKGGKKILASGETKALDVRTSLEVNHGKIYGSQNIDVMHPSFEEKVSKLDSDQVCIVYCRSGRRSRQACKIMAKKGIEKTYNLEGGFNSWSE